MNKDAIKIKAMAVSKLITDVTFCDCFDSPKCKRPTVYIRHKRRLESSYYHCVHVSSDGLMVNSNGHHPIELHDAMNEAVKVVKKELSL